MRMTDGEEDGAQGQEPQPQQPNGFKKVVVGVCVMEKKVPALVVVVILW